MTAFFSLLSVTSYVAARMAERGGLRPVLFVVSFVSTLCAMKTKETAFTLPGMLVLYEVLFFRESLLRRALWLAPFLLTLLVIPLAVLDLDGTLAEAVGGATKTQDDISRTAYLLTQVRVVVTYLRLLLVPVGQNLDYDYPISPGLLDPGVLASLVLLAGLLWSGIALVRLSARRDPAWRLVGFGVFWFFLALSVESSFIALADVIFEHRLYLPSAGAFVGFGAAAALAYRRLRDRKAGVVLLVVLMFLPLAYGYAASERNEVWRSRVSLWGDVVSKSPRKARAHHELGIAYYEEGHYAPSIVHLEEAARLSPRRAATHYNLGLAYSQAGRMEEAVTAYRTALRFAPGRRDIHHKLALGYLALGLDDLAQEHFRLAGRRNATDLEAPY